MRDALSAIMGSNDLSIESNGTRKKSFGTHFDTIARFTASDSFRSGKEISNFLIFESERSFRATRMRACGTISSN